VERALDALTSGEDRLVKGRDEPIGTLRISAPVSFGRRHVGPVLGALVALYPRLSVLLTLDDRVADLVGGAGCGDPHRRDSGQFGHDAQAGRQSPHSGGLPGLSQRGGPTGVDCGPPSP
jgi:hypothetical protein